MENNGSNALSPRFSSSPSVRRSTGETNSPASAHQQSTLLINGSVGGGGGSPSAVSPASRISPTPSEPLVPSGNKSPPKHRHHHHHFQAQGGSEYSMLPSREARDTAVDTLGSLMAQANSQQKRPVWVYIIFRKNPSSGHEKLSVKESLDGPIFWSRQVIYVFCCSCHFDRHEQHAIQVLEKNKALVERVCLVDNPLDYAFLPDSLFCYLANSLPKLEFVYLRELDLEKINRGTVERLSKHPHLKKLVVHGCRNYEVLQDFHYLPQLLVIKGDIVGLKAMLGEDVLEGMVFRSDSASKSPASSSSSESGRLAQNGGVLGGPAGGTSGINSNFRKSLSSSSTTTNSASDF